jgi:hypothetical protein
MRRQNRSHDSALDKGGSAQVWSWKTWSRGINLLYSDSVLDEHAISYIP